MIVGIAASASPAELLEIDAKAALMELAAHPVWRAALDGTLSAASVRALVLAFAPALAGSGRYIFSAKVSQIDREDGAALFRQLFTANTDPAADADAGWRRMAAGLGISEAQFGAALDAPSAEASDFVDIVREHSLRVSPAEATAVAWAIERQLPALLGAFADSLVANYGLEDDDVAYLRYEAGRAQDVETWINHLVDSYFLTADPYTVFEARRAAREAVWAWTALTETVQCP